jgi:hypothetical protein
MQQPWYDPDGDQRKSPEIATGRRTRESELFIGTQFSILYTFVYSPA